jgi:hypothetical protein
VGIRTSGSAVERLIDAKPPVRGPTRLNPPPTYVTPEESTTEALTVPSKPCVDGVRVGVPNPEMNAALELEGPEPASGWE